nr:hypothetical protein [Tanacetum cinerariifolium]
MSPPSILCKRNISSRVTFYLALCLPATDKVLEGTSFLKSAKFSIVEGLGALNLLSQEFLMFVMKLSMAILRKIAGVKLEPITRRKLALVSSEALPRRVWGFLVADFHTEMDLRSFMVQRVDGEFNFHPDGGLDENRSSTKSVNNEALMINVEPISTMHPLDMAENILDSRNTSSEEGGLSLIGPDVPSYLEVFPSAKELKDATDCHWVVAYVTPPFWKQHLREISIEQLCDIHDKAFIRQAILDNVLN